MSDCCLTLKIKEGNAILGTLTVTNAAGQLVDLVACYAWSHAPDGTLTPITPVHLSLGTYTATFTGTEAGQWVLRMSDSPTPPAGASVTVEATITVQALLY